MTLTSAEDFSLWLKAEKGYLAMLTANIVTRATVLA